MLIGDNLKVYLEITVGLLFCYIFCTSRFRLSFYKLGFYEIAGVINQAG